VPLPVTLINLQGHFGYLFSKNM